MGKETKEFRTSHFDSGTNIETPITYIISPCGAMQGRRLVLKIVDLIKPDTDNQMSKANMAKAIMSGTDDKFIDKADKVISELFEMVYLEVDGQKQLVNNAIFDSFFSGKYDLMLEILMEVLDYNGFLDLIRQGMTLIPAYFPK